jgi:hypothetical protein
LDLGDGIVSCFSVKFKDLDDTFYFNTVGETQEFLRMQESERFYDKSLRKGYFDYKNEHGELFRYFVKVGRGNLELLEEKFMEKIVG